jgi:hypothetical protein
MRREFVQVVCNIDCKWEGLPPTFRAYVNDELFTERTWIWTDHYLEEMFQISAIPGKYYIKFELVQPCLAELTVMSMRVTQGTARMKSGGLLKIGRTEHESQ